MDTTAGTPLTRLDRCDRCGAAALLRAVLATGGELLFCGHHAREHGPALHVLEAQLTIELSETHSSARRRLPPYPVRAGHAPG
jgi:hypothetical protein